MKDAVSIPYLTVPVLRGLDLVSHLSERDCQPLFENIFHDFWNNIYFHFEDFDSQFVQTTIINPNKVILTNRSSDEKSVPAN